MTSEPRTNEWTCPRSHTVPTDARVSLPHGYRYAGFVERRHLTRESCSLVVKPEDFGPGVVGDLRMLLILPAVVVKYSCQGPGTFPDARFLYSRRPAFLSFREGDTLDLWAASQRRGEVLLAPLAEVHGPVIPGWLLESRLRAMAEESSR